MKVKVYANWDDGEIVNKATYDKMLEEEVAELVKDDYEFFSWIYDNFDISEIWNATDADRITIRNDWEECCKERARREFDYEEVEIEI